MMLEFSTTLKRRIAREIHRAVGTNAAVAYYSGEPPASPDEPPTGEKLDLKVLNREDFDEDALMAAIRREMPKEARYWRLFDATGLVVMQGDDER